ncbi:helix-turn-helix domain-containing protein [Streptomyces humicola]|nr:helix-turn-helix transcriptional regulator [Streptomyces humicola]
MRDEAAGPRVGAAIRRQRRAMDLTLAEVARRTGLSVPFLSQIENNRARPSMRSLQLISDALDTTAVQLLAASEAPRRVDVVRAGTHAGLTGAGEGRARPLVRGHHQLHALEFTGEHGAERVFEHRNDEILYVADGEAEVEADGHSYRLSHGDTLYLSGGVKHRWRALVPGTRVVLVGVADHIDVAADPHR